MTITTAEYNNLEAAYDWLNADLFSGRLPAVLLTLQRKSRAMGYFSSKRFEARGRAGEHVDELALNPATFSDQSDFEILQTLAHEMCHVWQDHFGSPSRSGYHNREWAKKMMEIGLMPSSTGQPGGKVTGQNMSDYLIPGGPFERSANKLLATGFVISWQSREQDPAKGGRPQSKVKFTCPECGQNVWGKPSALVLCGECSEEGNLVRMASDQPPVEPA